MGTLPQLIEEDIRTLDQELKEILQNSEASTAMVVDKGGFLINSAGEAAEFDLTTIAALASGAYLATQTIANLVQEPNFNSVYHQGEKFSLLILCIDEHCLLTVIFPASVGVGAVKYFALPASARIANQLAIAAKRDPGNGMDLSVLNIADTASMFKKKS
jgi:predicted regulator of Ras-like GTPase activity (Roadblock/LC7/MglB family)